MCQSKVYLNRDGKEEEILRDAIMVESCADGVKIQGLFNPSEIIPARISSIDLLKHKIILEPDE